MQKMRKCALSGEIAASSALLRFVASPEDKVVFDLQQNLPGEDIWLLPRYSIVLQAMEQGLFNSLKQRIFCSPDLSEQVERQLRCRALGQLNLLRRSGKLISGFEKVKQVIVQRKAELLLQAEDASEDGRAKLAKLAAHHGIQVIVCYLRQELAQVTGQDNQVHIALLESGLTDKFTAQTAFFLHYKE
jgi:uncharacterized protein